MGGHGNSVGSRQSVTETRSGRLGVCQSRKLGSGERPTPASRVGIKGLKHPKFGMFQNGFFQSGRRRGRIRLIVAAASGSLMALRNASPATQCRCQVRAVARGACRVSAHDPCEGLSRCVLVVPVSITHFMWDEAVVLDKRLDSVMRSRDKWRVFSKKRSAVSGSSCIQSPCEVTDCKCAYKRQKQEMLSACEVTAEPVCEVTAEQAHEVKDAEPTQPALAEPTALAAEQANEVKDAEPTQADEADEADDKEPDGAENKARAARPPAPPAHRRTACALSGSERRTPPRALSPRGQTTAAAPSPTPPPPPPSPKWMLFTPLAQNTPERAFEMLARDTPPSMSSPCSLGGSVEYFGSPLSSLGLS